MRVDPARLAPELQLLPPGVYLVGGAVRDALLGRTPNDYDLAAATGTAAQVAREFARKTNGRFVDLGRDRFTTLRVVVGEREFDFSDFQGSLEEDLARRDATVNAIALDLHAPDALIDPFDGLSDLEARTLRMVRESNFVDDPLRILKLVRMAVLLEFSIEPLTLDAMRRHAGELTTVAMERIETELERIFNGGAAAPACRLLMTIGVDELLLGRRVREADVDLLQRLPADDVLIWQVLVGPGATPPTVEGSVPGQTPLRGVDFNVDDLAAFAREHKWPTARLRRVVALGRALADLRRAASDDELAIAVYDAGRDTAERARVLFEAFGETGRATAIERIMRERGDELFATETLLTGNEIAELCGMPPGPRIGQLKREMLEAQLRGRLRTRAEAQEFVKRRD